MQHPPLLVIGAGNMGRAIVLGGVRAGILSPGRVVVADPDAAKRAALAADAGVRVAGTAGEGLGAIAALEAAGDPAQLLVAVKPQAFPALGAEMASLLASRPRVVISIMAGTLGRTIRAAWPGARVVRAMPNLPAQIGAGATAVCLSEGARPGDEAFALALFQAVGPLVVRTEEHLLDAFTAVAGSGPAYLFFLAEAMIAAAVRAGLPQADADRIVRQTLLGSAGLLAQSGETPIALRQAVTSKGGTTAAAVASLDRDAVHEAWVRAILAARDRGQSLARGEA